MRNKADCGLTEHTICYKKSVASKGQKLQQGTSRTKWTKRAAFKEQQIQWSRGRGQSYVESLQQSYNIIHGKEEV